MIKQFQLISMALLVTALVACGGSPNSRSAQLAGPNTTPPDLTSAATTPVLRPQTVDANRVRFLVVGDAGSGSDAQMAVGAAMADVCEAKGRATVAATVSKAEAIRQGCQFVLGLGDNIYEEGTRSAIDPQFFDKFERAYLNFPSDLPFFMVSGNHDNSAFFGGDGAGNARGENQVDYTYAPIDVSSKDASNPRKTPRWQMPSRYYEVIAGGTAGKPLLQFFAIDSNQVAGGFPDASPEYSYSTYGLRQLNWLKQGMRSSQARMKFAFAHHPYLSNGEHGNAGNYDDLLFEQTKQSTASPLAASLQASLLPVLAGQRYKDFMEEAVCDQADVYFNGHDHDLQWLTSVPSCGKTEFIVSGAGGKKRSAGDEARNLTRLQRFDQYGFFWVEVSTISDLAKPVLRAEMYNVVEGKGDRETAIVKIDGTPDKTVSYSYARVQDETTSAGLTTYLASHNDSSGSLTRRDAEGLPESAGFSGLPVNNCQATATPSGSAPSAARSSALIAAPGPFDPMQAALSQGLAPWSAGNSPSATLMAAMTQVTLASLDIADVVLMASSDSARQPQSAVALQQAAGRDVLARMQALGDHLANAFPAQAALPVAFKDMPTATAQYRRAVASPRQTDACERQDLSAVVAPLVMLSRSLATAAEAAEQGVGDIPVLAGGARLAATALADTSVLIAALGTAHSSAINDAAVGAVNRLLRNLSTGVLPLEQAPAVVADNAALPGNALSTALMLATREVAYRVDQLIEPALSPVQQVLNTVLAALGVSQ
jgi:hypothetical protein